MDSREPSAAPSSGGDTIDDQAEDVRPTNLDAEHDDSAADLPTAAGTPSSIKVKKEKGLGGKKGKAKKGAHVWINEGPGNGTEDEGAQTPSSRMKKSGSPDAEGRTQGTAVGTRRQANGIVGSVFSGSKVRHLKKPDGTPFWRKEIQYEFLRLVIEDDHAVFTRVSDGKANCTFADIYVDCMGRSSKTSKILKDRLQVDKQAAHNMAMICLLVNVGRMNTTLNFFPEMRAQLRTYHSIPSLQAYKSQKDYKSLQDAPRLKSILKGASEDTEEPRTLAALKAARIPRTNPVNLIFVLSQFAPDVAQLHFVDKVDFFDLAIRPTISSASRARAFLWLMWWYLEAPVHDQYNALNNPYGVGEFKDDQEPNDINQVPQLVPRLVAISEEEGDEENVDPEEEKAFAEKMTRERKRIMTEVANGEFDSKDIEHKGVKRLKKHARELDDDSDVDSARASPGIRGSPAIEGVMGMMINSGVGSITGHADSIEDEWEAVDPHPGRGRYKRIKGKNTPVKIKHETGGGKRGGRASGLAFDHGTPDTVAARSTPQPLPPGSSNHPILSSFGRGRQDESTSQPPKSRARTGYQRQLEEHRNSRIQWLLKKKQRDTLKEARARREKYRWLARTAVRVHDLDATYDSQEDDEGTGVPFFAGLSSFVATNANTDKFMSAGVNGIGLGGLVAQRAELTTQSKRENGDSLLPDPNPAHALRTEPDDYGEEAEYWLRILKRTKRRLETWSGEKDYDIYMAKKMGKKIPARHSRPKQRHHAAHEGDNAPNPEQIEIVPSRAVRPYGRGASAVARRPGASLRGRKWTHGESYRARRSEMSLNDEITQDLLAERSDDEEQDFDDGDDVDADGDGDGDGDVVMEDNANEDGEAEDNDSDVDMERPYAYD